MEFGAWSAQVNICHNFDASCRACEKTRCYLFTKTGALSKGLLIQGAQRQRKLESGAQRGATQIQIQRERERERLYLCVFCL